MNKPHPHRLWPLRRAAGFTLIEVMVTVAIVAILAGIALPAYTTYVARGRLVAMTNTLAGVRTAMEQFYQDNRQYTTVGSGSTAITSPCSDTTNYIKSYGTYSVTCPTSTLTATTYKLVATASSGTISGAQYTVDQANNQVTVSFPTSWGGSASLPSNANCWLMRKGDTC